MLPLYKNHKNNYLLQMPTLQMPTLQMPTLQMPTLQMPTLQQRENSTGE